MALKLINDFFLLLLYSIKQESSVRNSEREKNVLVEELTSQNARLTAQIEAANQIEVQLTSKLNEMKNQYSIQNNNLQVLKFMILISCKIFFSHRTFPFGWLNVTTSSVTESNVVSISEPCKWTGKP